MKSPGIWLACLLCVYCCHLQAQDIASLIRQANPGDEVIVPTGRHLAYNLVIDKPLTLRGEGEAVLDGEGRGNILTVRASDVTVRGLTLQNVGHSFMEDRAAIRLDKAKNCRIDGNTINNGFFGIYLENSSDCVVVNNRLHGKAEREATSGNGIHLWHCRNITIDNNLVRGHRDGIYLEFVENSVIRNNVSERHLRYGLHFMFSHSNQYLDNRFRHNGAGAAVMYTKAVVMKRNLFEHNWGPAVCGLLLKDIDDSEICDNLFVYNTTGIYSEGSNRLRIHDNEFADNGCAVKLMGNSLGHVFTANNFVRNTFDVTTNTYHHQDNEFRRNYWSEYQGYDLDRDGSGDVPYYPVRLFAYILERQPAAIVLLRSFLVQILDTAERVMPQFTPESLFDPQPQMSAYKLQGEWHDRN